MDPHSFIARAEAQRWLGIAEKLLMGNDFVGSKTFAIRARESDPRLEAADHILAIADTLLAAEKRVVGNNGAQQPDFYAILQLVRFVQDTEHIASQYRRLAVMLNPQQNRFPYSDQAFQLVNEAWGVLSNPMRKSLYDAELDFPQQMNHIGFNLEQQHHQQHQHHHQQQHQHNFFSLNRMGSGQEQDLAEPPQTFQTRVQRSHQQQQLQQHNFLSQPNPVRPMPVREQEHLFQQREQEQLFQPQVQPFQITSTPQQQTRPLPQPAAPPQPPLSWPQAPPTSQPQPPPPQAQPQLWQQQKLLQPPPQPQAPPPPPPQPQAPPQPQPPPPPPPQPWQPQQQLQKTQPQPPAPPPPQPWQPQQQLQKKQLPQELQQEQEQQEPEQMEQIASPVQLPSQVNINDGVRGEEIERETEAASEDVDASPTFWTACPYCLYMYEYPSIYADCALRCDNCKRAFQAVPISSPPPIIEGQEAYFCCWGSFPLGVSISHLEKNNSNWTPFSPFNDVSRNVQANLNESVAKKNRSWEPRIYIDDVTDDIFTGISEPSDDSDVEWGSTKKKKAKRMKKDLGNKKRAKGLSVRGNDARNRTGKNLQNSNTVQEGVGASTAPLAESSIKPVASNTRRQSGRVAKELGKLDLNVEFNNNEGEEPAPRMAAGNRGHGQGEEDNIEGIGFFEGLDEFLSSLPILSVVNDEKGKAA